jgi:arabinose-5-phosphate isomerase
MDADRIKQMGREVLEIERDAVSALLARVDDSFVEACRLMLHCHGRVVVLGMGKSGHIGSKLAATLASTGTPAFFVHPGEARHGDLGMITPHDVVLAISYSGETEEVVSLLPLFRRLGVKMVALTGKPTSSLAQAATVHIDVSVAKEACPLDLAPTASTTATLAIGDALAVALLEARGFTREDFALKHPGGSLGKKLLKVADLMHTGDHIPKVPADAPLAAALDVMSQKSLGVTAVVGPHNKVLGVYTDGDLRRSLKRKVDIDHTPIAEVMTRGGWSAKAGDYAVDALRLMEKHRITALLVTDDAGGLAGVIHMHDLLRAGVV